MRNPWKLTSFALGAVAALAIAGNNINTAGAEPQPHMKSALGSLEQALGALTKATADKGGHRIKAMDATKLAIDEVKAGIEFDNKH